jgi:hypothetical protein
MKRINKNITSPVRGLRKKELESNKLEKVKLPKNPIKSFKKSAEPDSKTVKPIRVSSTNLKSIAYDDKTSQLTIVFLRGDKKYIYSKVPKPVFYKLRDSRSKGSYFFENIKFKYKYKVVE